MNFHYNILLVINMQTFFNELLLGGISIYIAAYLNIIKPQIDKTQADLEKNEFNEKNKIYYEGLKTFIKAYKPTSNLTASIYTKLNEEKVKQIASNSKKEIISHCPEKKLWPIINTFYDYMPEYCLFFLTDKIQDLSFEKKRQENNVLYKILGSYEPKTNTIYLNHPKPGTLEHEFIHAASTRKSDELSFVGFSTHNTYFHFFDGLNEGFTEMFNKRIFGFEKKSYKNNVKICQCLELLFTNPKELELAFFLNDIDYLYQGFLEYGTEDEFAYLNYLLDVSEYCHDKEKEMNDLIFEIIKRTKDENKIKKAEEILSKKKEKKLVKILR